MQNPGEISLCSPADLSQRTKGLSKIILNDIFVFLFKISLEIKFLWKQCCKELDVPKGVLFPLFIYMNKVLVFLAECSPKLLPFSHTLPPLPAWTLTIQDSLELPRGGKKDLKIILEIGYLATFLIIWKLIKSYFIYNQFKAVDSTSFMDFNLIDNKVNKRVEFKVHLSLGLGRA